jgi:hypothetical protein
VPASYETVRGRRIGEDSLAVLTVAAGCGGGRRIGLVMTDRKEVKSSVTMRCDAARCDAVRCRAVLCCDICLSKSEGETRARGLSRG